MGQLYRMLFPLLVGIVFGATTISVVAWRILRSRIEAATSETSKARIELATLREQNTRVPELQESVKSGTQAIQRLSEEAAALQSKLAVSQSDAQNQLQQNDTLRTEIEGLRGQVKQSDAEQARLKVDLATTRTELEVERRQTPEKTAFLNDLANQILEDKSKRFTAQNQENLDQLLGPLKTKLQEFKERVEQVYDKEGTARTALTTQVEQLMSLNQQLSQDAHDLTHALKGSGKTQGDWGEMILERVLEMAGLRKGQEYEVRETYKREDGSRAQPDVVIHLPENKHIVVDSKVSVTAYADYSRAANDSDRKVAIALHLDSVRRHIKELSDKNYHTLYDLNSLDFVIMFVPVEPAFMLALSQDDGLCESAWKKNVLLVSPTTFLFVVRTVAYLWRQEQATRSVRELSTRGAEFYDKLVGFVTDLAGVGNRLRQASQSYENARNKLVEGRGNLIRQAEMLRELGVKPTKNLPQDLVESALTEQPLVLPNLVAVADGAASDGSA